MFYAIDNLHSLSTRVLYLSMLAGVNSAIKMEIIFGINPISTISIIEQLR